MVGSTRLRPENYRQLLTWFLHFANTSTRNQFHHGERQIFQTDRIMRESFLYKVFFFLFLDW